MSYTKVLDYWVGEQWGDGGVYWFNHLSTPKGIVTSSSDALKDIVNYANYEADGSLGITTSATTTVLTDTNLTLVVNALTGWYLTYATGPAAGLSLAIVSNTADTITTATFSKTPTGAGGDNFVVTQFPLVERGASGTFTNSSDGNLSWITWGPTTR